MLLRWEFLFQAILILSPISAQELPSTASKIAPKSLWGSNKNALIQGITADEIASTGVATQYDYVIVGAGPGSLTLRVPSKPARLTSWLSARQISHSAGRFLS
jgi:hypothetical protein